MGSGLAILASNRPRIRRVSGGAAKSADGGFDETSAPTGSGVAGAHCSACSAGSRLAHADRGARGASLTTLYEFCHGVDCPDGAQPVAGLLIDQRGDLLGTTLDLGGGFGAVFELIPNAEKTAYSEVTLHHFCGAFNSCPGVFGTPSDRATPAAGRSIGPAGLLFGTTLDDGQFLGGTVFVMRPLTNGEFCCEAIEYNFCSFGGTACTDGTQPAAGVIFDEAGNFYTTTQQHGKFGGGTVFVHFLHGGVSGVLPTSFVRSPIAPTAGLRLPVWSGTEPATSMERRSMVAPTSTPARSSRSPPATRFRPRP
jgi:hypothetical protein